MIVESLRPLLDKGVEIEAEVCEDKRYGSMAYIRLSGPADLDRQAVEKETSKKLDQFTLIRYIITWQ